MKKLLITTLFSAIAIGSFAQTPSAPAATAATPKPAAVRQKVDANGDGFVSRDEAKTRTVLDRNFDAIDANKDGKLSPDEIKTWRAAHKGEAKVRSQERAAARFKKLDTNSDGALSMDEAAKRPRLAQNFAAIDTNKDGKLTPVELQAFAQARQTQKK